MSEAKHVTAGDLQMYAHDTGGTGRPFVLVHGFTGSSDDFVDVLPALAQHGRTVAFDNRGHGDTTNPGTGYTLEQMATDVGAGLDALGVDECDLLGHSLGGMVALRFVLANPERVASLVLMDTAARSPDGMEPATFEVPIQIARSQGMTALAAMLRQFGPNANPPEGSPMARSIERMGAERFWQRIEYKLTHMDPEAFACLGALLAKQDAVSDRLDEISCPTTVLVGDQDQPFLAPSKEMAAGIPNATLAVIPEAMHSPQFENTAAWLEVIADHLARARG